MKKSKFNLSHNASLTASMGNLIPFCIIDCLPNDSHRLSVDSFIRAQPMMAPLMHNVRFYCQWWFVPYRILWNNWTEFITGGEDGSSAPVFPTIKVTPETSSLADYFGIPVNNKELEVSALPFRAYAEIWNTRYRDEDLQSEISISYDDGADAVTNTSLMRCSWAKDYFTTARPWTQRGSQISVPVSSAFTTAGFVTANLSLTYNADILCIDSKLNNYTASLVSVSFPAGFFNDFSFDNVNNIEVTSAQYTGTPTITDDGLLFTYSASTNKDIKISVLCPTKFSGSGTISKLSLSLVVSGKASSTGPVSSGSISVPNNSFVPVTVKTEGGVINSLNIRDLRLSSALQRYQERSLEYGNRYEEFIQREFGIRPRDSRIQRPEYLGGSKSVLQISEVLQTAEGTDTGVGTMRGHGVGGLRQRPIRFRAPEHGIIIGIFSIRPDSVYTQGLARQWTKFSKLDYYIPELANVGMQEVFQSELYATGDNHHTLFGYSPRYEEYRRLPNRIAGEFRKLLDYWNLARSFEAPPVLNSSFITMKPTKRVFAEQTQDSFLIMLRNNIKSYRVVPKRAKNILR